MSAHDGIVVAETTLLTPETTPIYDALGIRRSGCYLIRPDMYIAYRSAVLNVKQLQHYLLTHDSG